MVTGTLITWILTYTKIIKLKWGRRGTAPSILNPNTRWRWAACPTAEEKAHGRQDGCQSRSGLDGERTISQPLPGIEPRSSSP